MFDISYKVMGIMALELHPYLGGTICKFQCMVYSFISPEHLSTGLILILL